MAADSTVIASSQEFFLAVPELSGFSAFASSIGSGHAAAARGLLSRGPREKGARNHALGTEPACANCAATSFAKRLFHRLVRKFVERAIFGHVARG
jgi:hypothetical protein